ncbi:MAG TPA: hypothetical protein VN828_04020 [Acidobacteriaceae bacterium]|nr:hypothetical protein [Acidobacteriaceae bacterium]
MSKETTRYSLQMCPVELCNQSELGVAEMEIVAQPNGPGEAIRTRSRQWLPIFERICTLLSSSPFQRKLMHRTLTAGVAMHVLDRTNGEKLLFSEEEIAALSLDKPNAA